MWRVRRMSKRGVSESPRAAGAEGVRCAQLAGAAQYSPLGRRAAHGVHAHPSGAGPPCESCDVGGGSAASGRHRGRRLSL